jgi:hypothetical protein
MRQLTLTQSASSARNAACIVRADQGDGNASIRLLTAPSGDLLAVRKLAKPCAALRGDARLSLLPSATNDDVVLTTGAAAWGQWVAADGAVLAEGPVTDENGFVSDGGNLLDSGDTGPWVLAGTKGTMLYEGGLVLLTSGVIG